MRFDLKDLELFVAVAEAGSIAAAAARLHTVASAASKRMADLEAEVGVPLLQRGARGVTLTPAGFAMLAHARAVLAEVERLREDLGDFAGGVRGQVRIAATLSAIVQFLPQDLAGFLSEHPGVRIDLTEEVSDQVARRVAEHAADVGVMTASVEWEGLRVLPYRRDRLVLVVPANHRLASAESQSLVDLADEDWVGLPSSSELQDRLVRAAAGVGRTLRLRIRVSSFDAVCAMVAAGHGIGVVPERVAALYASGHGLCAVGLDEPWAERHFHLCLRADVEPQGAARLLVQHLSAIAAEAGEAG